MRAALALALMAGPALAQLGDDEAAILPRVLSAVPVDISDAHIGEERAILLADEAEGLADLVILAGHPDEAAGQPVLVARGLVWAGQMAGQGPFLDVAPNGSLRVHAQQTAIGRHAWEETLTLAERDGQVLVAGYTLSSWDRITAATGRCDWNLLSGRWESVSGAPDADDVSLTGREALRLTPAEWAARGGEAPDFCRFEGGD